MIKVDGAVQFFLVDMHVKIRTDIVFVPIDTVQRLDDQGAK